MLYERWRHLARERESEIVLREVSSGRKWSFGELARLVESSPAGKEAVVWPQGHSAEFVFAVLRAWRSGAVLCPLEPEQSPPSFPAPPAPCRHLKLTSATTGAARAVAFTEEQLAADGDNIVATMGLRPEWPNLGVISMAHSYGFSNLVLPLLLHGIPLTIVPSPLPEVLRSAADLHPAITLAAVPALWRAWQETGVIPRHVRRAISAGAPLPLALEQEVFEATGLKIHNFYGSTECGGIAFDPTEVPRLEEKLDLLATLTRLAPLLGLLGTVLGFMEVFSKIEVAGLNAQVNLLSAGIWQALTCTAAGLAVAIPLHAGHNYLVSRVNSIVLEMERVATEIVNIVTDGNGGKSA